MQIEILSKQVFLRAKSLKRENFYRLELENLKIRCYIK